MKGISKLAAGLCAAVLMTQAAPMIALAYTGGETESGSEVWVFEDGEKDLGNTDIISTQERTEYKDEDVGKEVYDGTNITIDVPDGYVPSGSAGILTPEGNLDLVDDIDEEDAELLEYMTVTAKDGSYFYIIVDKNGSEKNVHFLNAVDVSDLLSLMSDEEKEKYADLLEEDTESTAEVPVITEDEPKEDEAAMKKTNPMKNGIVTLAVFAVLGAGAAGAYYFFKIRPKKNTPVYDEDVEFYDDEDYINEDDEGDDTEDEEVYETDGEDKEDADAAETFDETHSDGMCE